MPDALVLIDASNNKVVPVTCPTGTVPTVTTVNGTDAYMPMATMNVAVDGIVKFVMSSLHNVAPNTIGTSDPGLTVGFGQTKCLKFTATGTFSFFCTSHSFAGTVSVQ